MTFVMAFLLRCNRCKRIFGPYTDVPRLFADAIEQGWQTLEPSITRHSTGRTRHYCPECVSKREREDE